MGDMVTLTIDGVAVTVPPGTLIVDAAKKIGNDIPVFCYHPKLAPVGMCRMCLVEIGRPMTDRATGEFLKDETGKPRIQMALKLETACTTPVTEGMVVMTSSQKVIAAREDVLEFLLTSHPLDCPICDKGGECPLQNLTIAHGPGESRFLYNEKNRLAKHFPLGELIFLDRERCIQCARCIRFQDEIVDDPVLEFSRRGRDLEIVTFSEPGFDSYFSGNTTDICPVGALTTTDFRFAARPWELNSAASICPHCPVGCNLTLNVRREAAAGGDTVVKRIMPRQNEWVNEIWICDKGRWGYHYTQSGELLSQPMIRRKGRNLEPVPWEEALEFAAEGLRSAASVNGRSLRVVAGGRLANEDLFNLKKLADYLRGESLLYSDMDGGDLVARYGLSEGSNLKDLGKGSAILVVSCDLEEEAPVWWLRVKQAAERGAVVIALNPRSTKLDRVAAHILRYPYGQESEALAAFLAGSEAPQEYSAAVEAFATAQDAIVIYGQEGLGLAGSRALAESAAQLVSATGHFGRPNNGLMATWPVGNLQGAWEIGFRPARNWPAAFAGGRAFYLAGVDPVGEDPRLAGALFQASFLVVQDLFMSKTAELAHVVLPALPFTHREGTYTNGERRVQRFYLAVPPRSGARADFSITASLGQKLGLNLEGRSAMLAFQRLASENPAFTGLTYRKLEEVVPQDPIIGREDLFYGGTSYANRQGLGKHLQLNPPLAMEQLPALRKERRRLAAAYPDGITAVPVTRLYDRGQTLVPSKLLHRRLAEAQVILHPDEAARFHLSPGEEAILDLDGFVYPVAVVVEDTLPLGIALVPRSTGLPIAGPVPVQLRPTTVPTPEI